MQNVKTEIKGGVLTITIDLTADTTPSKSGKTQVIASTRGNAKLDVGQGAPIYLGLNCYRKE